MIRCAPILIAAALASCAGARYAEPNTPLPPAVAAPAPVPAASQQLLAPRQPDSDATRAWFEREIELAPRYEPPPPPAPPAETRVVHEYVGDPYCEPRHSTFPINTALGAGIGAIIGNQSGESECGAAIGAGIGFLLDVLPRW